MPPSRPLEADDCIADEAACVAVDDEDDDEADVEGGALDCEEEVDASADTTPEAEKPLVAMYEVVWLGIKILCLSLLLEIEPLTLFDVEAYFLHRESEASLPDGKDVASRLRRRRVVLLKLLEAIIVL